MSWIAEYDAHGKEFPTCVHVTKTTGTITHGATYVPIEDGGAVRAEKAALERRIDELCAENEQLRQENQSIGMAAYEVGYKNGSVHYELEHCPACKNIADLQEALEENKKLRELVKRYHRLVIGTDELWSWQSVYEELQELGIEVN